MTGISLGWPVLPLVIVNIKTGSAVNDIRLAVLGALDVRTQTFVVADGDLLAIVAERANGVEMMIAAEARGAIALDDIEKQSILDFLRLCSEVVPARPLAARAGTRRL